MLAGNEREALLHVAKRLSIELGYREGEAIDPAEEDRSGERGAMGGLLSAEDDLLARSMRRELTKVANALVRSRPENVRQGAVGAALDGAEMVIRGELMSGRAAQLPVLMPSFVFLIAVPALDLDGAIALSRRTAEMVEQALPGRT